MTDPIKAKIQELCPDVMELKWGCKFLYGDKKAEYPAVFECWISRNDIVRALDLVFTQQKQIHLNNVKFEILGSPITLAVVLRAIGKHLKRADYYVEVGSGRFIKSVRDKGVNEDGSENSRDTDTGIYWNLEHDTYDQQSEETKAFIGSLLGAL
jgi:hypothetical protein